MSATPEIVSPCISICVLDEESGYCKGCWRTRDEIAGWGHATDNQRRVILECLKERRAADGIRPRRVNRRRK